MFGEQFNKTQNILGGGLNQAAAMSMSQDCASRRQSAKALMRVRIQQLRREADRLEALAKALPEELPQSADDALYALLNKR